jgi:hypothetical protein
MTTIEKAAHNLLDVLRAERAACACKRNPTPAWTDVVCFPNGGFVDQTRLAEAIERLENEAKK